LIRFIFLIIFILSYSKAIILNSDENISNRALQNINIKTAIELLDVEKEYINKNKVVRVCIDPSWYPFEFFNENNQYDGILPNFLNLLLSKVQIKYEIVQTQTWEETLNNIKQKKCDIVSAIHKTNKREEFLNFTPNYTSFPLMLVTKKDVPYLHNLKSLKNKKIAIVKGYAINELFKKKYPNNEIINVSNISQGLRKVEAGEVFGYIDTVQAIVSDIKLKGRLDLKINRDIKIKLLLSIGVRNDDKVLFSLLKKAINNISFLEKSILFEKLIDDSYTQKINYTRIIEAIVILFIAIITVLYWNFQLKKSIKKELLKNKEQESLLYYCSKQKSMKDLVGNISHQWRQPLNELSGMLMHIETKLMLKQEISIKLIENTAKRSRKIINFMSDTVDTFNNFYQYQSYNEKINVFNIVEDINFMIKGSLEENKISFNIECDNKNLEVLGNQNELKQVLISIVNNAREILVKRRVRNPKIDIFIYKKSNCLIIDIEDNAGGIDCNIINKVFDVSFSHSSKGIGIGLYISRRIIEDKFKGNIEVKNTFLGALFRIYLNSLKIDK